MRILERLQDGSDRLFYRVKCGKGTCILLKETLRYRFEQFLKIAHILGDMAPLIYEVDEERMEILMEDLGNESLFNHISRTRSTSIYGKILKLLKRIQSIPCRNLPRFDEEHYFYEIDYFLKFNPHMNHLKGFLLENARFISRFGETVFMHRDFQSRNIFLSPSGPRVIDFQTAHCGHPFYDLASLLWDPYVFLEQEEIEKYSREYGVGDFDLLRRFAIQRLSQALGAYRRLSLKKPFFEQFINPAEERLLNLIEVFEKGADS